MLMPGTPEEETQTINTEVGDIKLTMYVSEVDESVACFVSYSDYPAPVIAVSDPYTMLTAARDSTVFAQGGKLLSNYKISLGGNPGIAFVADVEIEGKEAVLRARNYVVGNRLFQIFAMALKGQKSREETAQFLSSFKLKKPS